MKNITTSSYLIPVLCIGLLSGSCNSNSNANIQSEELTQQADRVLVFSKTAGYRHNSIEDGILAIENLGMDNNFSVTSTEDSGYFIADSLSQFKAVVFLNTTETVFNENQRGAFQGYIRQGGGYAGIHSATDTEYDWPWYGELSGAYFDNHPGNPNVRTAVLLKVNPAHPATHSLPEEWEKADEWYNFGYMNDQVNVLLKLDTDSYEGSDHPGDHPISWYHEYDGGRAFYTGLGHTNETFSNPLFLNHLLGGLEYAMGRNE